MCRSQHLFQITAPVQQLMELDSVAMAGERVRVYVCTIWDVAALCYDVPVMLLLLLLWLLLCKVEVCVYST